MSKASILLFSAVLWAGVSAVGQTSNAAISPEAAIRSVIQHQVEAWNRHDLASFMSGYWNSPDLTFFSGGSETKGWDSTLARYRKTYESDGADMGTVDMTDLQVAVLAPDAAFVRGRWHLDLAGGKEPHGLFTLIFRKFPDGWKIVHDHTSAEK